MVDQHRLYVGRRSSGRATSTFPPDSNGTEMQESDVDTPFARVGLPEKLGRLPVTGARGPDTVLRAS